MIADYGKHQCSLNEPVMCQECADRLIEALRTIEGMLPGDPETGDGKNVNMAREVARDALAPNDQGEPQPPDRKL